MTVIFSDRKEAGKMLATKLMKLISAERNNLVMLALPRGGVPIAYEISLMYQLPYDVLIVRKIGHPTNPEFGIGALAEDGSIWMNPRYENVSQEMDKHIGQIITHEQNEILRRKKTYRQNNPLPSLHDKTVLIIDDGLATGVTARAAAAMAKNQGAARIILAVPVASTQTTLELEKENVEIVAIEEFSDFIAVGIYYRTFNQVEDKEVIQLLRKAKNSHSPALDLG